MEQVESTKKPSIIELLKKEIEKLRELNNEYKNFQSMDTEEELDNKIDELNKKITILQDRVQLRDEGLLVSKKEIENYNEKVKKVIKIKKEKSKILNDILEMLCENMNIKKKELVEELELEM